MSASIVKAAQLLSRHASSKHGIEQTPRQWLLNIHQAMTEFRQLYPDVTAGMSNSQLWNLIGRNLFR